MTTLKSVAIAAATLIALAACSGGSTSAGVSNSNRALTESNLLAQITEDGKLTVGTEAQYAPFEFKDRDGNFVGSDMYLAQQIADDLGVELEIVDMKFDGIIPAIQSGQVDLGIAAFSYTAERDDVVDFSDVYFEDQQALLTLTENIDTYTTAESLAGEQVGAQKGSIQSELTRTVIPDASLLELDKYPALALEVTNGNIAGLVADYPVAESLAAASNGALAIANFEFPKADDAQGTKVGKAVVIPDGEIELEEVVNETVSRLVEDGSYMAEYELAIDLANSLGLDN